MTNPNEISVSQLNLLIGTPDCPVVVDVCTEEDFTEAPYMVPGALRHSHEDLAGLAERLSHRDSVIICQQGKKLSHGVSAWLRSKGRRSLVLNGGARAWHDHPKTSSLPFGALPRTALWATRQQPRIDHLACLWLVRRFIDRDAAFLFVPAEEVDAVAARLGARALNDVSTVVSETMAASLFEGMLRAFDLKMLALYRMASVIRAADMGRLDASAEAAGLLALSVGVSCQFTDDMAHVKASVAIFDALFHWARDGFEEGQCARFGAVA